MDFTVPEEIEMLRETLRRFVTEEVILLQREHNLGFDTAPPKDARRHVRLRSKALGLYGLDMPAEVGGAGLSFSGRCLLEMEAHCHDTVFFEDVLGGAGGPTPILLAATEPQRQRYLQPLMAGEITTCFAISEPGAGSDATGLRMRAKKENGVFVLNGTKSIISNGAQADFAIVFAVTDEKLGAKGGITCFLVDTTSRGFSVRSHTCMGFTGFQGELVFEDCRVPAANLLGEENTGFTAAMRTLTRGRIMAAAFAVGLATAAYEQALAYAKTRHTFNQPIGAFQGIAWMLADMHTAVEAARLLTFQAAWKAARNEPHILEASRAKLFATETCTRVTEQALQIHGGFGYAMESAVQRFYRDCKVLEIGEGTSQIQRNTIARMLGLPA